MTSYSCSIVTVALAHVRLTSAVGSRWRVAVREAKCRVAATHCLHENCPEMKQEAQLMLTTGSTRLAVSRGQQTWYHSTCYI